MKLLTSVVLTVCLCLATVTCCAVTAAATYPAVGESMPDLQLPVPADPAQREYLGIESGDTFQLSDLPAEIVVIEIFSMYCPYCQREAPNVNRFYELVKQDPDASKRVRILGIGVNNSSYEVRVFQTHYAIEFPLIPDPDMEALKKVGNVRTPHFFVLKRYPDGSRKLIYSQSGGFGEPEAFLKFIIDAAK